MLAETAELRVEDGEFEVDESVFLYRLASPDVVSRKELIPQTVWRGARKKRIMMLGKAMSSLFKPLKQAPSGLFEVSLGCQESQKCFPMLISYCCDISTAKDMSAVWHDAERQHPCVRCSSTYEIWRWVERAQAAGGRTALDGKVRKRIARRGWEPGEE